MRYFYSDQNTPLHFIVCGMLSSKDKFLHMKRQFQDNVFILVKKGELNISANNHQYNLSQNHFIILKANELHFGTKESSGELEYFWVHFTDHLETTSDNSEHPNSSYLFPEIGTINNSNKTSLLFNQLLDFYMNDGQNQQLLDFSLSLLLLELTSQLKNQPAADYPPVIHNAISWIKANYTKNFSLQEISDFLNYSPARLSALFKKNLNMTIPQFTNHLRIETSKNLLTYFGYSIKECAYECGFEDEKYFMKVFKASEGITPTDYKNAFYKKNIN